MRIDALIIGGYYYYSYNTAKTIVRIIKIDHDTHYNFYIVHLYLFKHSHGMFSQNREEEFINPHRNAFWKHLEHIKCDEDAARISVSDMLKYEPEKDKDMYDILESILIESWVSHDTHSLNE